MGAIRIPDRRGEASHPEKTGAAVQWGHALEEEVETEIERRTLLLLGHMEHSSGESDRGLVLSVAAQADAYLEDILRAFLVDHSDVKDLFEGPYAPFGSLSGKIKAAFVLGLITKNEADEALAIRTVRNVFAHEIAASVDHPEVRKLCSKPPIAPSAMIDRDAFFHMAMNTVLPLLYRSVDVRQAWKREILTREKVEELRSKA